MLFSGFFLGAMGRELVGFRYSEFFQPLIVVGGKIVSPVKVVHQSGYRGVAYYEKSEVDAADLILIIDVSSTGIHYCRIRVNDGSKTLLKSVEAAMVIHPCPILLSLYRGLNDGPL